MTSIIFSKDTIAALHQLHPLPSDRVFSLIFYYKFEHNFVLDRTLFAHALAIVPHLFLSGLSKIVYHFLGCFISKDPSSRFLNLFQVVVIASGDILGLVALMLRTRKLLIMAKDTGGLCLILVGKAFLQLINRSIVLQLWGCFKSIYPSINLEF
jgi:hypothetical protein